MKNNVRYSLIGPTLWIFSVQYYIVQLLIALTWHYSLTQNTISDLGNTVCSFYGNRYVCSPNPYWMNLSFVVLGLTMIGGSLFMCRLFTKNTGSKIGFAFLALAGLGTILVGLFPENTVSGLHVLGATLPFVLGNLGLIILGTMLNMPKWLRSISVLFGVIALLALALFMTHNYLGIGIGGIERIVAYPQSIWMIIIGLYAAKRTTRI